jgi:hypothetical protein
MLATLGKINGAPVKDGGSNNSNSINFGGYSFDPSKYKPANMKKGGVVSASKRADGCAIRGKTKGRMV